MLVKQSPSDCAEATNMEPAKYVCVELQQSLESRRLEIAYLKACNEVQTVYEAEQVRQLQVQRLLLEDDHNELQAQLAQDDDRIDDLERYNQQLQEDLNICERKLQSTQGDLRIRSREIETLEAELTSLHGVTMDSAKLLTEKLTLARELASLKPELDHLRSQVASHQILLGEKLFLQRQLSAVQVELETEKRATQRALVKQGRINAEDGKLESRVESLQADLTRERRERQKIDREVQKVSTELENKNTTLESRLEALRAKLKTTKEQLKETQTTLHKSEACAQAASSRAATNAVPAATLTRNPRKRAAVEMDADTLIRTPGDLPAAKRGKKASTLPGEKSTFSITPFLNRTASAAPDSPASELAENYPDDIEEPADSPSAKSKPRLGLIAAVSDPINKSTDKPTDGLTVDAKTPGILELSRVGKANSRPPPVRKAKVAPTLEKVAEEENNENGGSTEELPKPTTSKNGTDDTTHEGIEMKKRKRKLLGGGLGKTLFDEDDGDALKGDRRFTGGVRGFGTLAKGGLGGLKYGPRKALGAGSSGFGTISPLKKDKKAL